MRIKLFNRLFISAFILLLLSCSNIKSSFDYDDKANFSNINTYQWDMQPAAEFSAADPLVHKRIVSAIEASLANKGFLKTENAETKISYTVNFKKKLKSRGVSTGIGVGIGGYNRGLIGFSRGSQLREVIRGILIVNMVLVKSDELIWRSTSRQSVTRRSLSPEESRQKIALIVNDMFDHYPPKK